MATFSYRRINTISWSKLSVKDVMTSYEKRTGFAIQCGAVGVPEETQTYEEIITRPHLLTGGTLATLNRAKPQGECPITQSKL